MLKAVILAGGRGIRLKPLTDTIPKPMIEIKGKPFLQYQVELLRENGISEMLLCVGYLREKIMSYFGNGSKFNVRVEYSTERDFLGTGGALKIAEELLPANFVMLYGDSYLPIDYMELLDFWSQSGSANVVVCYDNNVKIAENNIYIDRSGTVIRYSKTHPDKDMNYVEAGVAVLKKEILDVLPKGEPVSLEEEVFPTLITEQKLRGYPTKQRFYDIGTHKGLHEIERVLG